MDPEIGDIFDCRKVPTLEHFILVVGIKESSKKSPARELLFYQITSRTYKVFGSILEFFNDCVEEKYHRFHLYFSKEEKGKKIYPTGKLADAYFIDGADKYNTCLGEDSMILINREPERMDMAVFENLKKKKLVISRDQLDYRDVARLVETLRFSKHISPYLEQLICSSHKKYKTGHPPKKS